MILVLDSARLLAVYFCLFLHLAEVLSIPLCPLIKASFFVLVQPFICASLFAASLRVSNFSVYLIFLAGLAMVYLQPLPEKCSLNLLSRLFVIPV